MYQVVWNNCMRNTWREEKVQKRAFYLCEFLFAVHICFVYTTTSIWWSFFFSWWNNFGSMQFQIWKVSSRSWHIYLWWNIRTHFKILQIHFGNGLYLCIFLRLVWAEQYCSKNSITIWSKELLTERKYFSEHRQDKNKNIFLVKQN